MPLDLKFQKFTTAPPLVTTVNFTDIIQNLGFIELYGATVHDGTNENYILTSNSSIFSFDEFTNGLTDKDFPITFGNFFDIMGNALITIPVYITNANGNAVTTTITLTLTTPEGDTVLGTATASTPSFASGNMSPRSQMITSTINN